MVFFVFILLEILKTFGNMSLNFSLNLENFVIIFSNVYSTPLLSFWISNGMHIFLSPIGHLLFSHSVMSNSFQSHGLKHVRLPCPSLSPWVCSNWHPLSQCWPPTISFSVTPFSSCPQSCSALGSFLISWLSLHQIAKVLQPQFQHKSFQWFTGSSFKIDRFDLLAVQETLKSLLQHHS